MLYALHGNAGLPDDLSPLLHATGQEFHAWHLWHWLQVHPDAASFDGFAEALNTAAASKPPPRVLLGYSLGGRLALYSLTQQPGAWDAAILLSTHPGLTNDDERETRLTQDLAWAERFLREPWDGVMRAWNGQPVLAGVAESLPDRRPLEGYRRQVAAAFDVWSLGRQPDLRPILAGVTCPVLWITGEKDAKFTELAAAAAALTPGARHAVIPNAGHRVHLDQPAAVAAAVRAFLADSGR